MHHHSQLIASIYGSLKLKCSTKCFSLIFPSETKCLPHCTPTSSFYFFSFFCLSLSASCRSSFTQHLHISHSLSSLTVQHTSYSLSSLCCCLTGDQKITLWISTTFPMTTPEMAINSSKTLSLRVILLSIIIIPHACYYKSSKQH